MQQAGAVRVLIVDDSVVARSVIARTVDALDGFTVVAAVSGAGAAFDHLRSEAVDLVLLDLEMPGIDGLTALPELIALAGDARVLVVSSSCGEGAVATLQALSLGAADTLVKPGASDMAGRFDAALREKLLRLTDADEMLVPTAPPQTVRLPAPAFDVIAIGASTGGIHALNVLLRGLPPTMDAPILITQHLPESFTGYFAAQVAALAGRPCDVAVDYLRIRPGRIVVAPGNAHIRCVPLPDGAAIRLLDTPSDSGCMPSVDPMFASVAQVYGPRALAIVLSGMGRDGRNGAADIVARGGTVIAQDADSSVVWGMPGAVAKAGLASAVLAPEEIAALIARTRVAA